MFGNNGKVEQIGTPREIYGNPETPFTAEFMGQPIKVENINKFKDLSNESRSSDIVIAKKL